MLHLDKNGHLVPHTAIEVSMGDFEHFFVKSHPRSRTRGAIFENYQRYLSELKTLMDEPFFQLLDGSFTTQKLHPEDLDVVTFLGFQRIEALGKNLDPFKKSGRFGGIDGYFEKTYPENHPFEVRYRSDLAYWMNFFSRNRAKQPKGFLKIQF